MKRQLFYLVPCCLAGFRSASAQNVPAPRSPSQLSPPAAVGTANRADADLAPAGSSVLSEFFANPFRWGPIDVSPHIDYSITYGNGLQSSPGVEQNTLIQTLSPGVAFRYGPRWSINYTPRLTFYSHEDFQDTLAHDVSLVGGAQYRDWLFGLSQSYSVSTDPLIETGQQTEQETFLTGLTASHPIGSKMLLELTASQAFRFSDDLNDAKSWSTMEWLNYQFAPRLSVGGGVGFGYDDVTAGSDMFNEQIRGRVDFRIAQKVNLAVNGGIEMRQFVDGASGSLVNPVYGASIQYRPFEYTTLSLSGARTVSPSLFDNQITESTDISLAIRQRLLGKLYLTLSGAYIVTDYLGQSAVPGTPSIARSDERAQFMASLGYSFTQRIGSSIFYTYSQNSSSADAFTYDTSEIGLNLSYRY